MSEIVNPPRLPSQLGPVMPVLGRRGVFLPEVGGNITITLPGEFVRGVVTEVLSHDAIVVRITGMVIDKVNHGYKRESIIPCRRTSTDLSETWEPISDREVREQEAVERARAMFVAPEPEPEPEVEAEPEPTVAAAPPAPEAPHRVLGPRRNRVGNRAPKEEAPKRSAGPRRSRVAKK